MLLTGTVSDPSHARYGKHLTEHDVRKLVQPAEDTDKLVRDWLSDNGIAGYSYSGAKDWITVSLPVERIESLLNAEYSVYRHDDGSEVVRTPEWSLPRHLHEHIDTVQPSNSFFRSAPKATSMKGFQPKTGNFKPQFYENPTVAAVCNVSAVTPLCLRTLYGTINYEPQVPGKNKVGLTDYLGEANNRSDVSIFLQQFRPEAVSAAYQFKIDVINGGDNQQTPDTPTQLASGKDLEGNLDAETILGIDWPTPLIAYTTGGSPPFKADNNTPTDTNEPYLTWLSYVLATSDSDLAQTISTSYDDDEQSVPPAFASRVCNELAQLGARGVSLFYASGDEGVGVNGSCISNNGTNALTFLPEFPSTCPYITSVGATVRFAPEVVAFDPANGFASGGGFSSYFARPSYQDKVVPAYLASLNGKDAAYFNASGRGYPDIAAQGTRFVTVWNGSQVLLDGTSAATPTAAAVIALVNDALIAAGRPPLGFLNPWLYAGGYKAFTDVTSGSAIGCSEIGDGLGFPAEVGWDAVSGFGTPNFPKILQSLGLSGKWEHHGGWGGNWQ